MSPCAILIDRDATNAWGQVSMPLFTSQVRRIDPVDPWRTLPLEDSLTRLVRGHGAFRPLSLYRTRAMKRRRFHAHCRKGSRGLNGEAPLRLHFFKFNPTGFDASGFSRYFSTSDALRIWWLKTLPSGETRIIVGVAMIPNSFASRLSRPPSS